MRPAVLEERDIGERALIEDLISESEQHALVDWSLAMRPYLAENGPGRAYRRIEQMPGVPVLYHVVRARLEAAIGLPDGCEVEPIFGWYLSIISHGGAVHPHIDPTPEGRRHLRCNLFLQLPESGGLPIIRGQAVPMTERSLLAFFPSEEGHSSQGVRGARTRIICSFGYLTPVNFHLPDFSAHRTISASMAT